MTIALNGPRHVVAAIPSLVGFQPDRSVVCVITDHRNIVLVTIRFDEAHPGAGIVDTLKSVVTSLEERHAYPENLVVVGWETGPLAWIPDEDEAIAGLHVRDALWAHPSEGRAGSYFCESDCCPWQMAEYGDDLALEMGRVPAESRESLAASCAWDGVTDVRRLTGQSHSVSDEALAEMRVTLFSDDARTVTTRDAALLASHCSFVVDGRWDVRDTVLGLLASEGRGVNPSVLSAYARFLSPEHGVTLVCLAVMAYLSGEGATANVLLNRAEDEGEMPTLGSLVRMGLERGIHPDVLREVLISALDEIRS